MRSMQARARRMAQQAPWTRVLLLLLALLLLAGVLRSISLELALQTLTQLSLPDLGLLVALNLLIFAGFTARWWVLLRALGHALPFHRLVAHRLTAFGISYFTPGPHFGGEPYQVFALVKQHQVPPSNAIAAVTMDKMVEMVVNFAFLTGGVFFLIAGQTYFGPWIERQLVAYALLLLIAPSLLLAALWRGRHPLSGLIDRLPGFKQSRAGWLRALRHSEAQAGGICRQHPGAIVVSLGVTCLTWAGMIGEFWLLTHLLELPITLSGALTAMVAARIAILLPMPAGLGALEAGLVFALGLLGLMPSAGLSIALVIRARDVALGVTGLLLGGVDVWRPAGGAGRYWRRPAPAGRSEITSPAAPPDESGDAGPATNSGANSVRSYTQ